MLTYATGEDQGCPVGWNLLTHRPLSSSFLGLPYRLLNIRHKKELLRGLWVITIDCLCIHGPDLEHTSAMCEKFKDRKPQYRHLKPYKSLPQARNPKSRRPGHHEFHRCTRHGHRASDKAEPAGEEGSGFKALEAHSSDFDPFGKVKGTDDLWFDERFAGIWFAR